MLHRHERLTFVSDTAPPESEPVRACEHCGADISHRGPTALCCNPACYRRSERGRRVNRAAMERHQARKKAAAAGKPPRFCEHCGKDISHRHPQARFCDQQCWWKAHYADPEVRERRLANSRRHKAQNRERRRQVARAYGQRPDVIARRRAYEALRRKRRCEECGTSILHLHNRARFCSKECWKKNYYARPEVKQRLYENARRARKRQKAAADNPNNP